MTAYQSEVFSVTHTSSGRLRKRGTTIEFPSPRETIITTSSKAVVAASKAIADAAGSSKLVLARDKE